MEKIIALLVGLFMKHGKIIFFITFFSMIVLGTLFLYKKPDELMFIPLILILGLGTSFLLNKNVDKEDEEFQISIFFIAFSLRIWLGFVIYGFDMAKLFGDEDASGYLTGWVAAQNWYTNGIDGFISDIFRVLFKQLNTGQSVIWGIPMFIAGGPSRLIVSVINSYAGSILVLVVYRIAKKLFDFQTAKVSAMLVTFWLSMILLSAGTSKEIMVICLEWSILYLAIRNTKSFSQKDIWLAAPLMLILYTTRFYAFYMCIAAIFFRAIITNKKNFLRNSLLGFTLVASLLIFLNVTGAINKDFDRLDTQTQNVSTWRTSVAATTGSGTNVYAEYQGSPAAIPLATVYFFFAPFPWQVFDGSLRNSFAAVENIALIIFLVIGFPAIKIFFKERFQQLLPILVFCGLYAGFHIWGLSNLGLAWRHKQTVMPLLFLLLALSITKNFKEKMSPVTQNSTL